MQWQGEDMNVGHDERGGVDGDDNGVDDSGADGIEGQGQAMG